MSDAASALAGDTTPTDATPPADASAAPAAAAAPAEPPAVDWAAIAKERGWSKAEDIDVGKLVVPDTPDAYELPVPDGESPDFAKAVAPLMHKAGLSVDQAKALAAGWNEMQTAQRQAAQEAEEQAQREAAARSEREAEALDREWGEASKANGEFGRRAFAKGAAAAGIDPKDMAGIVEAIQAKAGYAATMKLFAFYGKHFAEDRPHGLDARPGGVSTSSAQSFYDKSNMNP